MINYQLLAEIISKQAKLNERINRIICKQDEQTKLKKEGRETK